MAIAQERVADIPVGSCSDPFFMGHQSCTLPVATEIMHMQTNVDASQVWLACGGSCVIADDGANSNLLFLKGKEPGKLQPLPQQAFLHGYGPTLCLENRLAFINPDGQVSIYPVSDAGLGQPVQLPVGEIEISAHTARMSCDGNRFIAQDVYGDGIAVFDIKTATQITPQEPYATWLVVSADGRFALYPVVSDTFTGYRIANLLAPQKTIDVPAVPEIDQPIFSFDGDHFALIRRADDAGITDIYNLADGTRTKTLEGYIPAALPFVVLPSNEVRQLAGGNP